MLPMVDRQAIIHMYRVQGLGKNEITRIMGNSFHTVDKVIKSYEAALASEQKDEALNTLLCVAPRYDSSKRTERIITDEVADLIAGFLHDNEVKRSSGLKKQCMRKIDIHAQLVKNGFKVAYSTVCQYIRRMERKKNEDMPHEAYIRQYYSPGQICEFDWGEVHLLIRGERRRFYIAVFTLAHSNGRYAYLFSHQNALAFMESHRNFFREVKGVPFTMVYDNMRVAIKSFVGGKTPTETLLRMADFYCYNYRFCNIRAGWEKGHVERSVEYVRRKAFCIDQDFDSVEDAQNHLSFTCCNINAEDTSISTSGKKETLESDIAALRAYPGEMGCFQMYEHSVDKWSSITVMGSHYSVPDNLVGRQVSVRLYSEKISIFYDGRKVAAHERCYKQGSWVLKLQHYLDTFLRKPGSLNGSLALKQAEKQIVSIYESHFTEYPKDFVQLIQYSEKEGFSAREILMACNTLKENGIKHITLDQVKLQMHSAKNNSTTSKCDEASAFAFVSNTAIQERQIQKESENALDSITACMTQNTTSNTIIGASL